MHADDPEYRLLVLRTMAHLIQHPDLDPTLEWPNGPETTAGNRFRLYIDVDLKVFQSIERRITHGIPRRSGLNACSNCETDRDRGDFALRPSPTERATRDPAGSASSVTGQSVRLD